MRLPANNLAPDNELMNEMTNANWYSQNAKSYALRIAGQIRQATAPDMLAPTSGADSSVKCATEAAINFQQPDLPRLPEQRQPEEGKMNDLAGSPRLVVLDT